MRWRWPLYLLHISLGCYVRMMFAQTITKCLPWAQNISSPILILFQTTDNKSDDASHHLLSHWHSSGQIIFWTGKHICNTQIWEFADAFVILKTYNKNDAMNHSWCADYDASHPFVRRAMNCGTRITGQLQMYDNQPPPSKPGQLPGTSKGVCVCLNTIAPSIPLTDKTMCIVL